MWPNEPDEFVPNHEMQPEFDHGDAWYFPFLGNDLVCKREQGAPEPITADDFRWIDLEIEHKHFLGHFANRPRFALWVRGQTSEGFQEVGLRGLLGRTRNHCFILQDVPYRLWIGPKTINFVAAVAVQCKITPVTVPNIVEAVGLLTTRAYPPASLCWSPGAKKCCWRANAKLAKRHVQHACRFCRGG